MEKKEKKGKRKGPRKSKTSRLAIAQRRLKVARLYAMHLTQLEIAEQLGYAPSTICSDLKQIRKAWQEEAAQKLGERKARELAELDEMERQAALGYTRTKHPRFLQVRTNIKKRTHKLLGLDKPLKIEADLKSEGSRRVAILKELYESGEPGGGESEALPAAD